MTGYASISGSAKGLDWVWEARSVNARGLDLRVRVPDAGEALEADIRKRAPATFTRGSISITLRINASEVDTGFALNPDGVQAVLEAANRLQQDAEAAGLTLAPLSLGDLLNHRATTDQGRMADRFLSIYKKLAAGIPQLLEDLDAARTAEGTALHGILIAQIDEMARLAKAAAASAEARAARSGALLKSRVAALLGATDRVDEDRLAQELALLTVKADVTEELDRLDAHIASARELLTSEKPVGRKLDFLMQEFNREANTLCSKSGAPDLTNIGLDLKVVIDQLREQAANVE